MLRRDAPYCTTDVLSLSIVMPVVWEVLNIELSVDLLAVLLVVMIFTLSVIFRYGAALQQESDEIL